jgi:hypothetical protein
MAPAEAVARTKEADHADAVIGRVASRAAGDDDDVGCSRRCSAASCAHRKLSEAGCSAARLPPTFPGKPLANTSNPMPKSAFCAAAVGVSTRASSPLAAPDAAPGLSIHNEVYEVARHDGRPLRRDARSRDDVEESIRLRPMSLSGGAFVSDSFPVVDLAGLDLEHPILTNPALGRKVAETLGNKNNVGVLLPGQGFVLTGGSLQAVVNRAYHLRKTALIQQQAIALRGNVAHLDDPAPPSAPNAKPPGKPGRLRRFPTAGRRARVVDWVYWRQIYWPAE